MRAPSGALEAGQTKPPVTGCTSMKTVADSCIQSLKCLTDVSAWTFMKAETYCNQKRAMWRSSVGGIFWNGFVGLLLLAGLIADDYAEDQIAEFVDN